MPATMHKLASPFPADIARILERIGSRKRSAYLTEIPAGSARTLYSYWDGGSRDEYAAWDASGQPIALPIAGCPGFSAPARAWTPAAGDVLVEYGTFMGKPATPRITRYI